MSKGKRAASSNQFQNRAGAPLTFGSFASDTTTGSQDNQTLIECDSLGDDFRIPFRHLNKKDAKTKIRALKDLRALFEQCETGALDSALGSWVRATGRLGDDSDRQVRQEVWEVMRIVMTRVKKGLLPHMKRLMGGWWLRCHDPAKEVREAATVALEAGIPRKKWHEVLWMCRAEVIQHLCDVLQQTQDSVIQARKLSKQEALQHLHMTLPAALSAMAQFISTLADKQQADQLAEAVSPAVQPFFWKLAKSPIAPVRRALFGVVAQLSRSAPDALSARIKAAARALLGGFSERDGVNIDSLWPAVLLFCKSDAAAAGWDSVDTHKVVWPPLWQLVRHGGHVTTCRAMLPFLMLVPARSVQPVAQWVPQLLGSLWEAQFSQPRGCAAAVEAYWECVCYAAVHGGRWDASSLEIAAPTAAAAEMESVSQENPPAFYKQTAAGFVAVEFVPAAAAAGVVQSDAAAVAVQQLAIDRFLFEPLRAVLKGNSFLEHETSGLDFDSLIEPIAKAISLVDHQLLAGVWQLLLDTQTRQSVQLVSRAAELQPSVSVAFQQMVTGLFKHSECTSELLELLLVALSSSAAKDALPAQPLAASKWLSWVTSADDSSADALGILQLLADVAVQLMSLAAGEWSKVWLQLLEQPAAACQQVPALIIARTTSAEQVATLRHEKLDLKVLQLLESKLQLGSHELVALWMKPSGDLLNLSAEPANHDAALVLVAELISSSEEESSLLAPLLDWLEVAQRGEASEVICALGRALFYSSLLEGSRERTQRAFGVLCGKFEFDGPFTESLGAKLAQMLSDDSLYTPHGCVQVAVTVSNLCHLEGGVATVQQSVLCEATWQKALADDALGGALCVAALSVLMKFGGTQPVHEHLWLVGAIGAVQQQMNDESCELCSEVCAQLQQQGCCLEAAQRAIQSAHTLSGLWLDGLQQSLTLLIQCQPEHAAAEFSDHLLRAHCTEPAIYAFSSELLHSLCSAVCENGVCTQVLDALASQFGSTGECQLLESVLCCWKSSLSSLNGPHDFNNAIGQCVRRLRADLAPSTKSQHQATDPQLLLAATELFRLTFAHLPGLIRERELNFCQSWLKRLMDAGSVTAGVIRLTAAVLKVLAAQEVDEMEGEPEFISEAPRLIVSALISGRCEKDGLAGVNELFSHAISAGNLDASLLGDMTWQLLTLMGSSASSVVEQQIAFQLLYVGLDAVDVSESLENLNSMAENDGVENERVFAMLPRGLLSAAAQESDGCCGEAACSIEEDDEDVPSGALIAFMFRWLLVLHKYCQHGSISKQARSMVMCALSNSMMMRDVMSMALPWLSKTGPDMALLPSGVAAGADRLLQVVHLLEPSVHTTVEVLMHHVVYVSLLLLPAEAQTWFSSLDRASVQQLQDHEHLSIKTLQQGRHIAVTFVKDELELELIVRLPETYPLKPVEVECEKRVGVAEALWRKWLLQMKIVLSGKNGSILEAILQWQGNVSKHFEGIEDCSICYSIVHVTNNSLPKLECAICHNQYHAACLYKWFTTSHKSTCPMCTNPWTPVKKYEK